MSYEYRVLKHSRGGDDYYYAIYEVYNEDSWSAEPVYPWDDSIEGFEKQMKIYNSALDKPVLLVDGDKLVEIEE
jgi:hypothetical protein